MEKLLTKKNRYSDIVPLRSVQLNLTKRQIEYMIQWIKIDKEKFRSVGMGYVLEDLFIEHYNLSILEDNMKKFEF